MKMINKYHVLIEAIEFDGTMNDLNFLAESSHIDDSGVLHFFDGLAINTVRKGDYLSIGKSTNHIHIYRAGSLTKYDV
ncbi:hypothetical protein [Fusobacterium sp. PH5-44]|uniref:hypothetical protein n=1 Tax=unclassified Fusobacterium TaxID=2648384 RepID=UPI003D22955E